MSKFWWQEPEGEDLANAVTDTVNKMIQDHSYRYNLNMDMLRMYTGRDYEALDRYDPSNRGTMPFGKRWALYSSASRRSRSRWSIRSPRTRCSTMAW